MQTEECKLLEKVCKLEEYVSSGADSGLVKLVEMTNFFFNN